MKVVVFRFIVRVIVQLLEEMRLLLVRGGTGDVFIVY